MFRKTSVLVIAYLALAAAAEAQTGTLPGLKLTFETKSVTAPAAELTITPTPLAATTPAPAARRGTAMNWRPMVMGGLYLGGGSGILAGGGAQGLNLAGREEFALQIDGFWSNVGLCEFCDDYDDIFDTDTSSTQIGFSGSFLYLFNEMTNGWRPFAGGGITYNRFSYDIDFDDEDCGFIDCDVFDIDDSVSSTTLQIQGGLMKNNMQIEGRLHPHFGGAFLVVFGYKFGGSN